MGRRKELNKLTKLKQLRKERGFTQQEFAYMLGYKSVSKYNEIENGNKNLPVTRALIAKEILGCSLSDIFLPSNFPKRTKKEEGE